LFSKSGEKLMQLARALAKELIELSFSKLPFAEDEGVIKLSRYMFLKNELIQTGYVVDRSDSAGVDFEVKTHKFSDLPRELQIALLEIADQWDANTATVVREIGLVPELFEDTKSKIEEKNLQETARLKYHSIINERVKKKQLNNDWIYT